ncbi:trk system potassium uptake protein TrkA [Catalinimonas alkaloidigena]|uniref:Trk system potassium transporter TrkA n=1 Tax=Catalinimonas alkaloidigena TaxID=1075417 RepID=UPI002405D1EF|nr:Trk system potassium transporter TrkA [Catalinimonas alkaloidigena]MDF9800746.1 trk system potassium uptake protein TrkA [Catalinimonas alkaloidigena]
MRIIIAGAGDVGKHLAKLLAYENQDIVVIDLNQERLRQLGSQLDVSTIRGSATSFRVLKDANVAEADLLIAVTESEEVNLATSFIAKQLGVKRTVARISNEEYLMSKETLDLRKVGIDELISPESLAAREIRRLLRIAAVTDSFEFDQGLLSLIGITIDRASPLLNHSLAETSRLNPHNTFVTVAILRDGKTIIPRGDTRIEPNDHVYFIAEPNGIDRVLDLTGKKKIEIKNIMILGGSKAAYHTARKLSTNYNVKLIERDRDKCFELADQLPKSLIINGDGRDVEILEEEGLANMDAFLALTGDSETNIISCLVAKDKGVKKTIALVENIDYIHLSQNIGVDTMINKKLIAANFIFRYIRKGDVVSITGIHGVEAEILEYEVNNNCRIVNKQLKDLEFPKEAVIGGVVRNGKGQVAMGNFQFEPNDRVVILSKRESLSDVEKFFK